VTFDHVSRELTKDDWILVTVAGPDGREQTTGGRYDGMTIYNGAICIDYMMDDEEGFAMSAYLPYITKIELTTEEFLNAPLPEGYGED
jgi:hypothetical protein